jgi:glutamate synthase (NADPH/NADH) small chain
MKAYDKDHADTPMWPGKNVVVLGGGNVAMDSARMALRLGAEKVRIVYRRSMSELPARGEEIHHAQEEGVEFCVLQNPSEILGDENGRVRGMIVDKYELGAPDEKGRPRPVKLEGQSFEMECDTVLVAIGNGSNPLISQSTPELKVNKRGNIELEDQEVNKTFVERVYAGGDIVLGAATVILAMGEGRKAAKGINEYLAKN